MVLVAEIDVYYAPLAVRSLSLTDGPRPRSSERSLRDAQDVAAAQTRMGVRTSP